MRLCRCARRPSQYPSALSSLGFRYRKRGVLLFATCRSPLSSVQEVLRRCPEPAASLALWPFPGGPIPMRKSSTSTVTGWLSPPAISTIRHHRDGSPRARRDGPTDAYSNDRPDPRRSPNTNYRKWLSQGPRAFNRSSGAPPPDLLILDAAGFLPVSSDLAVTHGSFQSPHPRKASPGPLAVPRLPISPTR